MKLTTFGGGFSEPFPHTIIDNFIGRELVAAVNGEWPLHKLFDKEDGVGQRKWNCRRLPPLTQLIVDAITPRVVEEITGLSGLIADPVLFGAGLHEIPRGGFLKMHCDFNRHPCGMRRAVNLLLYLNEYWEEDWGGGLILSKDGYSVDACISPIGGRAVVFETNDRTWHGHPKPLNTPEGITRRSLALYFYIDELVNDPKTTVYKK
jgi:hypothetical protein